MEYYYIMYNPTTLLIVLLYRYTVERAAGVCNNRAMVWWMSLDVMNHVSHYIIYPFLYRGMGFHIYKRVYSIYNIL